MTVSEALAAHAGAQMAAARASDHARRVADDPDQAWPQVTREEPRSFIESWAINATVIGICRPN
jgi:predicted component of type VI protein secretion system